MYESTLSFPATFERDKERFFTHGDRGHGSPTVGNKKPEETLLVGLLGTEFDGLGFRLKEWEGV